MCMDGVLFEWVPVATDGVGERVEAGLAAPHCRYSTYSAHLKYCIYCVI